MVLSSMQIIEADSGVNFSALVNVSDEGLIAVFVSMSATAVDEVGVVVSVSMSATVVDEGLAATIVSLSATAVDEGIVAIYVSGSTSASVSVLIQGCFHCNRRGPWGIMV